MKKNSNPGWKKVGSRINIPDPQHWFQHGKFKTKKRQKGTFYGKYEGQCKPGKIKEM
jgi:hypothetical protein